MKDIELVKKLHEFSKGVFTLSDLLKILNVKEEIVRVIIQRMTEKGVLERVGRGLYAPFGKNVIPQEIAPQLYFPSYLSLKTVLCRVGIINQIPQKVFLVTTKKTYQTKLVNTPIVYRQIKKSLFFGYFLDKGIPTAYPEKALLDLFYYAAKGLEYVSFSELDLKYLDKKRWSEFKKYYPERVRMSIQRVDEMIGFK